MDEKKDEVKAETPKKESTVRIIPPPVSGYVPGSRSNAIITRRNGGVQHQFIDNIGGCSANYR